MEAIKEEGCRYLKFVRVLEMENRIGHILVPPSFMIKTTTISERIKISWRSLVCGCLLRVVSKAEARKPSVKVLVQGSEDVLRSRTEVRYNVEK